MKVRIIAGNMAGQIGEVSKIYSTGYGVILNGWRLAMYFNKEEVVSLKEENILKLLDKIDGKSL